MENTSLNPDEMRQKVVLDRNEQEVGRVRNVERELRTGRYSTLRVEMSPKLVGKIGHSMLSYLPIDVNRIERNNVNIRLGMSVEELNKQFCSAVSAGKREYDPSELIEKPAVDQDGAPVGTIRDFRATANHGEFPTVMIELRDDIRKKHTSGTISGVRVRADRIEHVGTEVRLSKGIEELSREWNEIVISQ